MDWQGKERVVLAEKQIEKAAAMSSRGFYLLANQKDVWWPRMTFPLPRAVPWEEDTPLLLPYSPSDLNLHFRFSLGFWIPNWLNSDWAQVVFTTHMREEECFVSLFVLIVLLVCPGIPLSPSELWVDQSGGWLVCELSHKLAASRIWKEIFIVKAVSLTAGLDFISSDCLLMICSSFVVFCLELLGSDLFCCRKVSGSQTSQNSCPTWTHGHSCHGFLSFIFLCCFFICPIWKPLLPSIAALEEGLRAINPSFIFWWVECKSDMEITDTRQEVIQRGRQEVQLNSQQQDSI